MIDLQDLPPAVANLLRRMAADPAQRLTYEMTGDGCSTGLSLTWTSLTCVGCQGAHCPTRRADKPRRTPRPRSWAMGDGFYYSSPEEEDDPYNFTLEASRGEQNLITVVEEGEECVREQDTDGDVTSWSGPGTLPRNGKPIPIIRVTQADVPYELLGTQGSARYCVGSNYSPDPDISEEEESDLLEGSESNSKCSECMDSGMCLDNRSSSFGSQAHGGGGFVTTSSSTTSSPEPLRRDPPTSHRVLTNDVPVTYVDQGIQTDDPWRLVKRCHAVWAALEQLYVYYDDKEQVLRLSEVDGEQRVMRTRRTEATLRTGVDKDGHTPNVALEMLWIGMKNES